jgi:hypothetical protein
VLDASPSNADGPFLKVFVFHHLYRIGQMEHREPISTLKNVSCRKYSFQKESQFSQGTNVLDAAASDIHGCLCNDTCVSSTLLNSPIWNKQSLSPL